KGRQLAPVGSAAVFLWGGDLGPEPTFPNQSEELGPHQSPAEGMGVRAVSSLRKNRRKEDVGGGPAGYSYQPLNQDAEPGAAELAPWGMETMSLLKPRVLGLRRPDVQLRVRRKMEREQQLRATPALSHGPRTRRAVGRAKAEGTELPARRQGAEDPPGPEGCFQEVLQKRRASVNALYSPGFGLERQKGP
uniref:Uncharacterized protein n=1 Tax=Ursus maritimus TaxID=29073 RepID=A0A452V2Q3_URSMA